MKKYTKNAVLIEFMGQTWFNKFLMGHHPPSWTIFCHFNMNQQYHIVCGNESHFTNENDLNQIYGLDFEKYSILHEKCWFANQSKIVCASIQSQLWTNIVLWNN